MPEPSPLWVGSLSEDRALNEVDTLKLLANSHELSFHDGPRRPASTVVCHGLHLLSPRIWQLHSAATVCCLSGKTSGVRTAKRPLPLFAHGRTRTCRRHRALDTGNSHCYDP